MIGMIKNFFFSEQVLLYTLFSRHHTNIHYADLQQQYQVRLVDGINPWEGRVEVFYDVANRLWATVCYTYWNNTEGNVLCQQLGYSSGGICKVVEGSH